MEDTGIWLCMQLFLILLFVYNRPWHVRQTLEAFIKE